MKQKIILIISMVFIISQIKAAGLTGNEKKVISSNTAGAVVSFSTISDKPWYWDEKTNRLRSQEISDSQTTDLKIQIDLEEDSYLCFDAYVSSESKYDYCVIKLDEKELLLYDSGIIPRRKIERFISRGKHVLTLDYHKDVEDWDNEDLAAISNLIIMKRSEWEERWSESLNNAIYRNTADASISFVNRSDLPEQAWGWQTGAKLQSADSFDTGYTVSEMDIVIDTAEEIYINFQYYVSGSNKLAIKIDDALVVNERNESYKTYRDTLSAGTHVINLTYVEDARNSNYRAYVSSFAVYTTDIAKGYCNDNIKWVLDKNNTLKISGTGDMPDYSVNYPKAPWTNCGVIKKVVIGDGITRIGSRTVIQYDCLTDVIMANSVLSIGEEAFMENFNLSNVVLSENLQTIESYAFSNCWAIKEIHMPKSISKLASNAFVSCTGMKTLVIGDEVFSTPLFSAENFSFYNCISLENIYNYSTIPQVIGGSSFWDCPKNMVIHVPTGCADAYKQANVWKNYTIVDDIQPVIEPEEGAPASVEAIDLGLPSGTLWANMNIGATSPEGSGDFFAWGETTTKEDYTWETYKWSEGSDLVDSKYTSALTKYNAYLSNGNVDNLEELEPEDDAATANWGSDWKMPTLLQLEELIEKCIIAETTVNNVACYLVTGPNGESIILPKAGYKNAKLWRNTISLYWSSTRHSSSNEKSSQYARVLRLADDVTIGTNLRYYGYNIRPVSTIQVPRIVISSTSQNIEIGTIFELKAISNIANDSIIWSSSDSNIASVYSGTVTANGVGTAKIIARSSKNNAIFAECTIIVTDFDIANIPIVDSTIHEWHYGEIPFQVEDEHFRAYCNEYYGEGFNPEEVTEFCSISDNPDVEIIDLRKFTNLKYLGPGHFIHYNEFVKAIYLPPYLEEIGLWGMINNGQKRGSGASVVGECKIEGFVFPATLERLGSQAIWNTVKYLSFKSVTPPRLDDKSRERNPIFDATAKGMQELRERNFKIYVPAESVEAYATSEGWNYFREFLVGVREVPEEDEDDESETDISKLTNTLYLSDLTASPGSTATLSLNMKNAVQTLGYQVDIYLPTGMSFATDEDGFYATYLSTERTTPAKTNYFDAIVQPDGALRILCSSTKGYAFSGNDGEVATIDINIEDNVEDGIYPIILKNIEMSDMDATPYKVPMIRSSIEIVSFKTGDVNGDDNVTVSDFTATANYILGNAPAIFNSKAADVNGDKNISVSDLTGMANIILYGNTSGLLAKVRTKTVGDVTVELPSSHICPGTEIIVPILINNNVNAFSAFQMDMNLPEGISVNNISLAKERATSKHALDTAYMKGSFRILAYSTSNRIFDGTEGTVAYITLVADKSLAEGEYKIDIDEIELSESGNSIKPSKASATMYVSGATAIDNVNSGTMRTVMYDLSGRKINTSANRLPAGMYIINGKKVSVK